MEPATFDTQTSSGDAGQGVNKADA